MFTCERKDLENIAIVTMTGANELPTDCDVSRKVLNTIYNDIKIGNIVTVVFKLENLTAMLPALSGQLILFQNFARAKNIRVMVNGYNQAIANAIENIKFKEASQEVI